MSRPIRLMVAHGVIGGLIAGAIVALWFLVVDLAAGDPFRTPLSLAAALLEPAEIAGGFRLIALYTVLHFTVFGLLGALAGYLLYVTGTEPGWLVGAFFGVAVITAVHYGALFTAGADVIAVLPPAHVVAANLVGGVVMMTYLHRALAVPSRLGVLAMANHPLLTHGVVTGFIGAAAVALWFFVLDLVGGQPFRTPAALGSLVFLGASTPAEVNVGPGIVGAYTLLHLLVFAAAGVVTVLAAQQLERAPHNWLILTQAFVTLEVVSIPVFGLLGHGVLGAGALWQITAANLLAVGAMAGWVWHRSPQLRQKLAGSPAASEA